MNYAVSIADMRTRITFQQPTVISDAGGAQSSGWTNVSSIPIVWARWTNEHGQEAVQNDSARSAQRATVTIRYRSDVNTNWQVLKDGEAWQILSIDQVQDRNRYVEMVVERVKGATMP
jgi:SPP1 family predicted phage head-tail adaptor